MAAIDLERAFRNPGRLALNPSSLYSTAYPGNGTALGLVRDVEFDWGLRYTPVVAEEWGETAEQVRVGEFPTIAVTLYQWDADVVQNVFPSVTTSSSPSGLDGISRINGAARPGLVTALNPIVFWPDDPRHPAVLIHRPLPRVVAPVRFIRDDEMALVLVFDATRNSSDKMYQVDLLEHLAL